MESRITLREVIVDANGTCRVIVRVAGYEPLRQLSHLVHLTFVLAFLVLGICGTRAGKVGSIQEAKSNLLQLTFSARC